MWVAILAAVAATGAAVMGGIMGYPSLWHSMAVAMFIRGVGSVLAGFALAASAPAGPPLFYIFMATRDATARTTLILGCAFFITLYSELIYIGGLPRLTEWGWFDAASVKQWMELAAAASDFFFLPLFFDNVDAVRAEEEEENDSVWHTVVNSRRIKVTATLIGLFLLDVGGTIVSSAGATGLGWATAESIFPFLSFAGCISLWYYLPRFSEDYLDTPAFFFRMIPTVALITWVLEINGGVNLAAINLGGRCVARAVLQIFAVLSFPPARLPPQESGMEHALRIWDSVSES